jgi:hypothetical protein
LTDRPEADPALEEVETKGIGPFVTARRLRRADGLEVEFSAWHRRKGHGLVDPTRSEPRQVRWWAPDHRGWWIAILFMVGSACFALGAFPATASWLGSAAGYVFFIGSIFFTSAAYLQYYEATNEGDDLEGRDRTSRVFGVRATSLGWWATAIQLIGTIAFNVSTFAAILDLTTRQEEGLVWVPDMVGSACFLVASTLAIMETHDRLRGRFMATLEARIAGINMLGSIAFGFSALAAFVVPATGELLNADVVNSTTFIGAVMFFVGALLLIPDMGEESPAIEEA